MWFLQVEDNGELVFDVDLLGIDGLVPEVDQRKRLPHFEVLVVGVHDPLVAELDRRRVHRRPVVEFHTLLEMEDVGHAVVGDVVALGQRGLGGEAGRIVFEQVLEMLHIIE